MNLPTIVRNGTGRAGHWRVTDAEITVGSGENDGCALWHYGTVMLVWRKSDRRIVYLSTGWGSVSDQQGMNVAFKVLGGWDPFPAPDTTGPAFYYSRKHGPDFVILDPFYWLAKIVRSSTSNAYMAHRA